MAQGQFNPARTAWHLTIGTYLSRPHGGDRPTVDRQHNQRGEDFIWSDEKRLERAVAIARGEPVRLTWEQSEFIESVLPEICGRGKWTYHVAAAAPEPDNDHVHVLLDADPKVHGKEIRKWLKRWLTDRLDEKFERPASGTWWVEDGSTKPVKDREYFENCVAYIRAQRTTK